MDGNLRLHLAVVAMLLAGCSSPTGGTAKAEVADAEQGQSAAPKPAPTPTQKIVFASDRDSDRRWPGVYVMNADGSDPRRLSPEEMPVDFDPDLSPDGTKIAFLAKNNREDYSFSLCVMDINGGHRTQLTNEPEFLAQPRWSPDGRRIAFSIANPWIGKTGIFVIDADGTNRKHLADGFFAFWAPDGKRVAFFGESGEDQRGLMVVSADGGEPELLAKQGLLSKSSLLAADWSPDGKHIAFVQASGKGEQVKLDLYIASPDGSGERRLTDTPEKEFCPQWIDGGKRLLFVRMDLGATENGRPTYLGTKARTAEIYSIRPDGTDERQLTDNESFDFLQGGMWAIAVNHPAPRPTKGNGIGPDMPLAPGPLLDRLRKAGRIE